MRTRFVKVSSVLQKTTSKASDVNDLLNALQNAQIEEIYKEIEKLMQGRDRKDLPKEILDRINELKRKVSATCYQAFEFTGDTSAKNANALESGLVIVDGDTDNYNDWLQKMQDYCSSTLNMTLNDYCKQKRVYFVSKTAKGGIRLVGEREHGETIAAGAERLANVMQMSDHDTVTFDPARKSYDVPLSYVYYINPDGLVWKDGEEDKYWTEGQYLTDMQKTPSVPLKGEDGPVVTLSTDVSYPREYDGIPFEEIVKALLNTSEARKKDYGLTIIDGEPQIGSRHNAQRFCARFLRYLTDFNVDWLFQVIPSWGQTDSERMDICQRAVSHSSSSRFPAPLLEALYACRNDNQEEQPAPAVIDFDPYHLEVPPLTKFFYTIARNVPENMVPAVLCGILPAIGTLATGWRMAYMDGNGEHSFTFYVVLTGPQASGKSCIRNAKDLILTLLHKQTEEEEARQAEYDRKKRACKNKEEQPSEEPFCIREISRPTISALAEYLRNANGSHCFQYNEELDQITLDKEWPQFTAILRQGFDNQVYSRQTASSDYFRGSVQLFLNGLYLGTERALQRMLGTSSNSDDVENGIVSRIIFAQLPDTFGTSMPVYDPYTDLEKQYVISVAKRLMETEGTLHYPKIDKAFERWERDIIDKVVIPTQSVAVDTFRRRAKVIGWRAAYLCALINEGKDLKKCTDFGLWVTNFTLRQQMTLFGAKLDAIRQAQRANPKVVDLLAELPQEFSVSDLVALRAKYGQSTGQPSVVIHRWKEKNYIIDGSREKTYVKLV